MSVGDGADQPLALRRAAVKPGHVGLGRCLIDEDQLVRVKVPLLLAPFSSRRSNIRPVLLSRPQGLFLVLRYLVWVETTSGGRTEVELSGDEIDDSGEVSNGAIATSLCLGGLYEAVDSLNETIGDLAMEPT